MKTDAIGPGSLPLAAEPTARAALLWLFCGAALAGAFAVITHERLAPGMEAAANFGAGFLLFLWYCRDGNARNFRRTIWWNMAMIAFVVPTVFVYLWHTRPRGQRLRAMLLALACVLLLLLTTGLGAAAAMFVSRMF